MNHAGMTVLVTGATGRQGGAVVQHLLNNNVTVRALSRTPDSISARRLMLKGVTVVKGDMADPSSLASALKGCDGVFSVQNYFECGGENEIQYGKNMVDAALKSNISHFIYNSVCGADADTNVPHFETKHVIEQYLKGTGLPATIFRPVKFMENYYIPQVFKGILGGKLFDAIKSGKKHQIIAADDIGKYAADAFINPDNYLNKTIEIAGDEMTNEQVAATMTEVLGVNVKFKKLPLFIVKLLMDKEMYLMFKWFNEKGFTADLEKVKGDFPSVKATTLKEFLMNENWQRWNKKGSV
jgi:uncharacterized protein YbjT (DUF2867 family)